MFCTGGYGFESGKTFLETFNKIYKENLPLKVPTAIAKFPKEYLEWAPRSYVERIYNIKQWTEMPAGGHFAALEQPDLLIKDIRDFARTL